MTTEKKPHGEFIYYSNIRAFIPGFKMRHEKKSFISILKKTEPEKKKYVLLRKRK